MSNDYYDVDAILTDAQKIPCTFALNVPGLGFIDGNSGGDMKQGTRVELPLWLGSVLAVSQRMGVSVNFVDLDHPTALGPRVLNALKADPRTVDLRSLAPHFYALGMQTLDFFDDDDMTEVLSDTFKKRAAEIADHAHNPKGALGDGAEFLRGLDESERQVFRAAHDSAKAMKVWMGEMKKR